MGTINDKGIYSKHHLLELIFPKTLRFMVIAMPPFLNHKNALLLEYNSG